MFAGRISHVPTLTARNNRGNVPQPVQNGAEFELPVSWLAENEGVPHKGEASLTFVTQFPKSCKETRAAIESATFNGERGPAIHYVGEAQAAAGVVAESDLMGAKERWRMASMSARPVSLTGLAGNTARLAGIH